jgi:hypothetical protein
MLEEYGPTLGWATGPISYLSGLAKDRPAERRKWTTRLCEAEPEYCDALADALVDAKEEKEAAEVYRRWRREAIDRVRVSNKVGWIVEYDRTHGREAEAWEIAREAAGVYSEVGLRTLAELAEKTDRLDVAETNFRSVAERYSSTDLLYDFYTRQVASGKSRFEKPRDALFRQLFPDGPERMVQMPVEPPQDGVIVSNLGAPTLEAGLKERDIIVGLEGFRVRSRPQ